MAWRLQTMMVGSWIGVLLICSIPLAKGHSASDTIWPKRKQVAGRRQLNTQYRPVQMGRVPRNDGTSVSSTPGLLDFRFTSGGSNAAEAMGRQLCSEHSQCVGFTFRATAETSGNVWVKTWYALDDLVPGDTTSDFVYLKSVAPFPPLTDYDSVNVHGWHFLFHKDVAPSTRDLFYKDVAYIQALNIPKLEATFGTNAFADYDTVCSATMAREFNCNFLQSNGCPRMGGYFRFWVDPTVEIAKSGSDVGLYYACKTGDFLKSHRVHPEKLMSIILGAERYAHERKQQPLLLLHELAHAVADFHNINFRFDSAQYPQMSAIIPFTKAVTERNPAYYNDFRFRYIRNSEVCLDAIGGCPFPAPPVSSRESSNAPTSAYAVSYDAEYFAEATESLFGANDWLPFNAHQFARLDPEGFRVIRGFWNVSGVLRSPGVQSTVADRLPFQQSTVIKISNMCDQPVDVRLLRNDGTEIANAPCVGLMSSDEMCDISTYSTNAYTVRLSSSGCLVSTIIARSFHIRFDICSATVRQNDPFWNADVTDCYGCTMPTSVPRGYKLAAGCNTSDLDQLHDSSGSCKVECDSALGYEGNGYLHCNGPGQQIAFHGCSEKECFTSMLAGITGYDTQTCTSAGLRIPASLCNLTCQTAAGWVGNASAVCPYQGGLMQVQGCDKDACSIPGVAERTGYAISGCPLDSSNSFFASECTISCASGYVGVPQMLCSAPGGTFQLVGCVESVCRVPTVSNWPGYDLSGCASNDTSTSTNRLMKLSECSAQCADGFHGTAQPSCINGSALTFAGCVPPTCVLPAASTEYDITQCKRRAAMDGGCFMSQGQLQCRIDDGRCLASCKAGYAGQAVAHCPGTGRPMDFNGCRPRKCTLMPKTGYEFANPNLRWNPVEASSSQARCAAGYEGTAVASCPADGADMQLAGCSEILDVPETIELVHNLENSRLTSSQRIHITGVDATDEGSMVTCWGVLSQFILQTLTGEQCLFLRDKVRVWNGAQNVEASTLSEMPAGLWNISMSYHLFLDRGHEEMPAAVAYVDQQLRGIAANPESLAALTRLLSNEIFGDHVQATRVSNPESNFVPDEDDGNSVSDAGERVPMSRTAVIIIGSVGGCMLLTLLCVLRRLCKGQSEKDVNKHVAALRATVHMHRVHDMWDTSEHENHLKNHYSLPSQRMGMHGLTRIAPRPPESSDSEYSSDDDLI